MPEKTVALIQARMSSTRLPGKVLKKILGRPMLELQLERVQAIPGIDLICVATSTNQEDDQIENLCRTLDVPCFRGQLHNVLDRYYQAARAYNADHVIRITADCPLLDPKIAGNLVEYYFQGHFDYASNAAQRTFPDGLDLEIFSFPTLATAWQETDNPLLQEHVTGFIRNHPKRFKLGRYDCFSDLSPLRWTVDFPEDFEFVRLVYEGLYKVKPLFLMHDILAFLEKHPEIEKINAHLVA